MIGETIARAQEKHTKKLLLVFILVTLALLPGIALLPGNVEPSLERVMPDFIAELETANYMRSEFGADQTVLVLEARDGLLTIDDSVSLRYIEALEARLALNELVVGTESIVSNPAGRLSFPSDAGTLVVLTTETGVDSRRTAALLRDIDADIAALEPLNPGFLISVTGYNVLDKETFSVIMSDFLVITAVSMGLIVLILVLFLRSVKKVVLAMSVLFAAVLWTMGITGYLGLTVTVVSMVSVAMLMGLGIDFAVHVLHTYDGHRASLSRSAALTRTHEEILRALVGAAATTIAGFLALLAGVLPAMKVLSIILAIGIAMTLIAAVGLLPLLLFMTDTKRTRQ